MMDKNQAKDIIANLTHRFSEQYDSYKRNEYNETLTRRDFIDPFFKALGWDVDNTNGFAEAYREVIHEDKIKIGGYTKAPDYSFRLSGGKRLFFVEAKKPSVIVKDEMQPAYQVRRYGWSAKLPISIITDFEELSVYDCTKKPNVTDKASVARIKYLTYKDYLNEFDFIWDTFSKERVLKGGFDKFIQSDTNKKGTTTVDNEFLASLDDWRTKLAFDVCKGNPSITEDELNFVVQQIIDRIIFLRIAEDRSVEPYGRLKECLSHGDYYKNLFSLFQNADDRYNSGLFDLKKDKISKSVIVDNKVVKSIINNLYYPESPYEFSVLPVEILGSAYEQFLGKKIKVGPNHKPTIEEKAEVRKAGGVYYTPQYIVQYIVQKTIGELVKDKKPTDVAKLKILDPACGSGSFLIGAYQFLLDWHKEYYNKNPDKLPKSKKDSPLTPDGNLTTSEKKRILINNIYGVDLDVNAVEVTKLSLLLKCMEGETEASINNQLNLFHERVLPTLDNNIKSGNSLIDTDFYDSELDFGIEKEIKPFNWKHEFATVFAKGGFDVVLGNPPYGADLSKDVQKYCLNKYPIGNTDTAALFMIQATNLLKDKGYNGYIIPKAFTYASNWAKTRSELIDDIHLIVDCSKVWREVKLEMSIYISQKSAKTKTFVSAIRKNQEIEEIGQIDKNLCCEFNFLINGVSDTEISVARKLIASKHRLNSFLTNRRGGMFQQQISTTGATNVIGGKQVQRYSVIESEKKIKNKNQLEPNATINDNSILVQNIVAHIQNPVPRIQITATVPDNDTRQHAVILDTVNQLTNKSNLSIYYLLGVLNSKIISWYTYKFVFANAVRTMHFDSTTTEKIPFPHISLDNKAEKKHHDDISKAVQSIIELRIELNNTKLASSQNLILGKIEHLENKINSCVADLFGLSPQELQTIN